MPSREIALTFLGILLLDLTVEKLKELRTEIDGE